MTDHVEAIFQSFLKAEIAALQYQIELKDQRIKQLEEENRTLVDQYHAMMRGIADKWREKDDQSQIPQ